jgi:ketosteroid isomerase-like protein
MSEQNLELTRAALEAWNRGDADAWLATFDEHAELYSLRSQLEGRPYRGHEGLREFLDDVGEHWAYAQFDVREMRDVGDRVLVLADFRAQGRASGVELDFPVGMVVTVRGKKIVHGRFFSDPDEAVEDVGLRE